MSPKAFIKNFENFRGLSYRSSNLSRPPNYALEAKNVRIKKPYNITGEPGFQIRAQPKPMYGIHNYIYQDANGQVQEELLGVNEILWKLSSTYLKINHVGAVLAGTYEINVNTATNVYQFILKENGVTTLTANLGTGYGTSDMTLQGLADAINAASSEYEATVLYTAVVNGNQANVGHTSSPIVIDSGGDMANHSGEWVELITDPDGPGTYRYIIDTTATGVSWSHGTELTVTDNQVLGHGLFPAAILPITNGPVAFTTTGGADSVAAQITYNYWKPVSFPGWNSTDIVPIFRNFYELKTGQSLSAPLTSAAIAALPPATAPSAPIPNASFVNAENVCFIAVGGAQQVCKYDGQSVYKAGHRKPSIAVVPGIGAAAGGAGALTGVYRYKFSYTGKDFRGRIVEGEPSDYFSVTLAAQEATLTLLSSGSFGTAQNEYNDGAAVINGTQAGVNTITVDALHTIRVGDKVYFYDTAPTPDAYTERLVTAVTSTTITVAGTAVSVVDNDYISIIRIAIYRTLASGTDEYYLVAEIPQPSVLGTTFTYTDNTTDANLGAQYIERDPVTKISYIPPYAKYLALHQGRLVAAEGFTRGNAGASNISAPYFPHLQPASNTISWSDSVGGLEAWPLVNEERISSQSKGQITGIASDIDDNLLVFKDDEIHSLVGDLDSNLYSQTQIASGSYGISSHNSIQNVSLLRETADTPTGEVVKFIIGLGKHGIVAVHGGKIVTELTKEIKGKFTQINNSSNKDKYLYRLSESCFNTVTNEYKVSLPVFEYSSSAGTYTIGDTDATELLRLDAEESVWFRSHHDNFELTGDSYVNYLGGMATHQDETYFVSLCDGSVDSTSVPIGVLFKQHHPSLGLLAYQANTFPVVQDIVPQWDFIGEPSIKKEWHQIMYYTFQPSGEFIPFSVRVRTYRNWADYTTATASTDYTFDFTSVDQVEDFVDTVRGTNAKSMLFRFTVSTQQQCINLTGYEFSVSMPMSKEQVKK